MRSVSDWRGYNILGVQADVLDDVLLAMVVIFFDVFRYLLLL